MKPSLSAISALVLTSAFLHAEVRTFTSSAGTTLQGELVSVNADMVTIKKADGQSITTKAANFSAADLAYLREHGLKPVYAAAPLVSATKAKPFINIVGMKFVPVPGTKVLMCIHETRRADYAAYAAEVPNVNAAWKSATVSAGGGDNEPVVNVSWNEAHEFCAWLGKSDGQTYRLTTDREWSVAVGIGDQEQLDASPEELAFKLKNVFPWGKAWPPPKGAGNYFDLTLVNEMLPLKDGDLASKDPDFLKGWDHTDGFAHAAPVMSFAPNKLGIYDMGGNVWEMCEDPFSATIPDTVFRGGCCAYEGALAKDHILSSWRVHLPGKSGRAFHVGFRLVVEIPKL